MVSLCAGHNAPGERDAAGYIADRLQNGSIQLGSSIRCSLNGDACIDKVGEQLAVICSDCIVICGPSLDLIVVDIRGHITGISQILPLLLGVSLSVNAITLCSCDCVPGEHISVSAGLCGKCGGSGQAVNRDTGGLV